ncbi:hypothetical protein NI25_09365 [Streptomyces sp. CCM_MD2014]|nr:hypothetical protein NI25_09365 [Streptomyces sp. CCM_MD2014]
MWPPKVSWVRSAATASVSAALLPSSWQSLGEQDLRRRPRVPTVVRLVQHHDAAGRPVREGGKLLGECQGAATAQLRHHRGGQLHMRDFCSLA